MRNVIYCLGLLLLVSVTGCAVRTVKVSPEELQDIKSITVLSVPNDYILSCYDQNYFIGEKRKKSYSLRYPGEMWPGELSRKHRQQEYSLFLSRLMSKEDCNIDKILSERFEQELKRSGYSTQTVRLDRQSLRRDRNNVIKSLDLLNLPPTDAWLDVNITRIGCCQQFIPGKGNQLVPVVTASVRLVRTRDMNILFADTFSYNGPYNWANNHIKQPDNAPSFANLQEVSGRSKVFCTALQEAVDTLATQISGKFER